ncbi:hypothetical protein BS78_08G093800 [Paspalum vaginatum]|nr:hypothetical protein BS78_08G093800 [Paspalum vaginatum]
MARCGCWGAQQAGHAQRRQREHRRRAMPHERRSGERCPDRERPGGVAPAAETRQAARTAQRKDPGAGPADTTETVETAEGDAAQVADATKALKGSSATPPAGGARADRARWRRVDAGGPGQKRFCQ